MAITFRESPSIFVLPRQYNMMPAASMPFHPLDKSRGIAAWRLKIKIKWGWKQ